MFSLLFLVILIYGFTLTSGTSIDCEGSILHIPLLSHIGNAPDIVSRDFMVHSDGQYRPAAYLLIAALRTLVPSGNIIFWHSLLLIFHALNVLLVFSMVYRLSSRLDAGFWAGGLFAVHPVCTEIVNDINQFHLLLGTTFSLLVIHFYLGFALLRRISNYVWALFFFLLALLTAKPALFLGLLIGAYETLYRKEGIRRSFYRALPFLSLPVLFIPVWLMLRPNPVYYIYLKVTPKSVFYSFLSVIVASRHYFDALVLTREIPTVLHEITPQIYSIGTPAFWIWLFVDLLVLTGAVWGIARKRLPALGIVLSCVVMLPYLSIALNQVLDYVSISYLYFPVVGYAIFIAGVYGILVRLERLVWKWAGRLVVLGLLIFFAGRTIQLNNASCSAVSYWTHALALNQYSQTAHCELGKALLDEGRLDEALQQLFNPNVKGLQKSCLAMTRHYLHENNLLAASIHFRLAQLKEIQTGLLYLYESEVAGEMFLQVEALDYAEHHFGRILMVDPCHTRAMAGLAQIWLRKGRVAAAARILERAEEIDPADPLIADVKKECIERERDWRDNSRSPVIRSPNPEWLRYVLHEEFTPRLLNDIADLGERVGAKDAVIQLEATIALIESERFQEASKKSKLLIQQLSGHSFACAVVCRALALAGESDLAVKAGSRAISLDTQNAVAWECLALAYALLDKPSEISGKFVAAIASRPAAAAVFYYNLGLQKKRKGLLEDAVDLFQKTIAAIPGHPDAYRELGYVYWSMKKTVEAIDTFQKAVAANPDSAEAHGALGAALLGGDRISDAVEELRTAIRIDPVNATYISNLGVALAKMNRDDEAVVFYRQALELDSTQGGIYFNLANSLSRLGQQDDAESAYHQTLERIPNHPYAHYNLALLLIKKGAIQEAIDEYQSQIECNPTFAQAYSALIVLYYNRHDMAQARKWLQLAKERQIPIDPGILKVLHGQQ